MKVIKHTLPEADIVRILPLADLHLGDIHADGKLILKWIDYIKTTPGAYAILNGDLMDSAIRTSIGDVYQAALQPMEQLKQCVKLFQPIADHILAVLPGNHENRIYRNDGVDLTEVMCSKLGIAGRYSPTAALLFIRFGKDSQHGRPHCYTVYCSHGTGSGRTPGAKINRLVDMANIVDADIYIMSHVHQPAIVKTSFFRTNMGNSSVSKVDKLFVNTAAALEFGGYGETALYRPASTETPLIILDGKHHRASAAL